MSKRFTNGVKMSQELLVYCKMYTRCIKIYIWNEFKCFLLFSKINEATLNLLLLCLYGCQKCLRIIFPIVFREKVCFSMAPDLLEQALMFRGQLLTLAITAHFFIPAFPYSWTLVVRLQLFPFCRFYYKLNRLIMNWTSECIIF